MMQGLYTGADAVSTYKNALISTAHNIANINTPYYKSNTLQLNELRYGGVNVSSIRQNQELSYTILSGRTLDFVIDGPGQFKLTDDSGSDYFTRRGIFYIDSAGNMIDHKGRMLQADVIAPDEDVSQLDVDSEGYITVNGSERGKLEIYDYQGNKLADDRYELKTGMVEVSDVDFAREVVDLMSFRKATYANYVTMKSSDEMLGLIVNLVG
jgi:flagellar hook protein FlgE